MQNKRGSLPVIVLVVLTFVLTTSTLVMFYLSSNKSVVNISQVSLLEGTYVKEDLARYYIYIIGKELLKKDSLTKENFISEFSKIELKESDLVPLQKSISEGKFTIDENYFEMDKEVFWIVSDDLSTVIKYTSRLKVSFSN